MDTVLTTELSTEILQDTIALSLAGIIAASNRRARLLGVDLSQSLITITERFDDSWFWRVNYGAKSYIDQRGGDWIIDVNPSDLSIKQVLRGQ